MAARLGYVDTIKGLVVGGVIVAHAGMTYGLVGSWPYRETPMLSLPTPLAVLFGAAVTVGMSVLFLLAGLFTPPAVDRKGERRFLGDRLRRLGIPIAVYLLAIMPALNVLGAWGSGSSVEAAGRYAIDRFLIGDVGPTWFVLALLLFTGFYLGARRLPGAAARRPLGGRGLALLAVLAGAGMFLVRLVQPATDLAPINLAVWPQDLAVFALGVAAARQGWARQVPAAAVRQSKALMVAGALVLAPLVLAPSSSVADAAGGWHWQSAVFCLGEALFTTGVTIWLFRQFQRIRGEPLAWFTRGSFTAYLIQAPVILVLGLGLRPAPLPVEVKLPLLAVSGLAVCFTLAGLRHQRPGHRPAAARAQAA